ncbi:MAG: leucine-rich repeat protein [Clostridia bacterium]|nr:leucine-rich repeat protein [Clostridia bacterium]
MATADSQDLIKDKEANGVVVYKNNRKHPLPYGTKTIVKDAYRAKSVVSVHIPASVTTIESGAFADCTLLRHVSYGGTVEKWLSVSRASDWDTGAMYLAVECADGVVEKKSDGYITYADGHCEEIPYGIVSIAREACYKNVDMRSVVIPDSVKLIGVSAFAWSGLTDIRIPDSVTYISKEAFSRCYDLQSISLPAAIDYIGTQVFAECKNLQAITIPGSVTEIRPAAFYLCTSLKRISIPGTVKKICERAFASCYGLVSVGIMNGVRFIEDFAFHNCIALKTVTIPGSMDVVGAGAFFGCTALESISFSEGIIRVNPSTFEACTTLTKVKLPRTLKTIGKRAFARCRALKVIEYAGTQEEWDKIPKGEDWRLYTNPFEVICKGDMVKQKKGTSKKSSTKRS